MKVVVILAPGFEEIEALSPVDYLRRAGAEVTVAGISAKDESFSKTVKGAHGINVESDISFEEYLSALKDELPDAVVIPGGMPGAANISQDEKVIQFIQKMNSENKFVCAICASPIVVLAKTGILSGKSFTCYPGIEQDVSKYIDPSQDINVLMGSAYINNMKAAIRDGNIITGRGPGAAEEFSLEIIKALAGTEQAMVIRASACMR